MNFVYDEKIFTSASILPLLPSKEASELVKYIDSPCVFSQDIRVTYSDWGKNIISPNNTRRNTQSFLLRNVLTNFWSSIKPNNIYSEINWECLLYFEMASIPTQKNYYHLFEGNVDKNQDFNIIQTAIRQTKNKGKVVFSQDIFCEPYQTDIKEKYNINVPLTFDIYNKLTNTYTKNVVLFMENIRMEKCMDDFGKYILVNPIYKYLK